MKLCVKDGGARFTKSHREKVAAAHAALVAHAALDVNAGPHVPFKPA
jgi:hypothetical protein